MKIILLALFLVSCATQQAPAKYKIYVDAISDNGPSSSSQSFVIFSGMDDVADDDLVFRRNAGALSMGLQASGYTLYKGNDATEADIVVYLSYWTSEPRQNIAVSSRPIYSQQTVTNAFGQNLGTISGFTGSRTDVETFDTYTTHILLKVVDAKTEKKVLWKAQAYDVGGTNPDINNAVPFLVKAAYPHFGKSTASSVYKEIGANDLGYLRKPAND